MEDHHANPFQGAGGPAAEGPVRGGGDGRDVAGAVRELIGDDAGSTGGASDEDLFAELGMRAQMIQAYPDRAGDLSISSADFPAAEGLRSGFAELGRRIFARLEREFHALLCGSQTSDTSDRAKLRDAFGLGADAVTAAIVGVLTGGLGIAPAIAAVVAALLVRRVLQPTYQETCALWSTRFE